MTNPPTLMPPETIADGEMSMIPVTPIATIAAWPILRKESDVKALHAAVSYFVSASS
jgi:hypothetical protein